MTDKQELIGELIWQADSISAKHPELSDKVYNIMYKQVDIENIHDYSEKDIRKAMQSLKKLEKSKMKSGGVIEKLNDKITFKQLFK